MSDIGQPRPTKPDLLRRLKQLRLPIAEVVDVGVRDGTPELLDAFPAHRHQLFEPATQFHGDIALNYRHTDHCLYAMALSDVNTTSFLVVTSLPHDGAATHSQVQAEAVVPDGRLVLACTPLSVRRFDSLKDLHARLAPNFLLKVDVDGVDLQVLQGFGAQLAFASVIIVECTFQTWAERMQWMDGQGFELFDLVDLIYYGGGLYQFDAAFVRRDLLTDLLRPSIMQFDAARWRPFVPN